MHCTTSLVILIAFVEIQGTANFSKANLWHLSKDWVISSSSYLIICSHFNNDKKNRLIALCKTLSLRTDYSTTQRSLAKCKRPWATTRVSPPSKVLLEANRVKFEYDACSVQFWILMLLISAKCVLLPNAYCFQGKVGSRGFLLQPLRYALRQVLSILDQMAAMSPMS